MASYNKEQAVGNVRSNSVPIAMRVYNLDVAEVMKWVWVCGYHYQKQGEFLALRKVPQHRVPNLASANVIFK